MSVKLEERMNQFSSWIGKNKILSSVSESFMMILPIIILGSIFTLLVGLNIAAYQTFIVTHGIKRVLSYVPAYTTEWISIYLTASMAYVYGKKVNIGEYRFVAVLLSLLSFLLVTPYGTQTLADNTLMKILTFEWLGAQGMFSALVIPVIVTQLFKLFVDKKWVLKMPESVPPAIQASFTALIPSFVIGILFITLNAVFALTPFNNFHSLIYGLLLLPLQNLSNNIWTILLLIVMIHVIWFFGMHGTMILGPVILIMMTNATLANTQAYASNQPLPNILTLGFLTSTMLGGIGSTLGLSILMLFAKSKRYKGLSKICIVPSIFGINEPIVFGMPIVLNPALLIPFIAAPLVNTVVLYLTMKIGWVNYPALMNLPTGTPVFVDGILQMGMSGLFVQVALLIIDIVIYYPFFRKVDRIARLSEGESHV